MVPVTAMTLIPSAGHEYQRFHRCASASLVFLTCTYGMPDGTLEGSLTMRAAAPLATASGIKSCPSQRSPLMHMKTPPDKTVLESDDICLASKSGSQVLDNISTSCKRS